MPIPEFILRLREKIGHDPLWLPGVTAVVRRERAGAVEVLLGRRSDNGEWAPISGIPEPGEQPALTAARECLEETGCVVRVDRLASTDVTDEIECPNGDLVSFMVLTFACTWISGEARVGDDESLEVGWFAVDAMPEMSSESRWRIEAALADEVAARFAGVPTSAPVQPAPESLPLTPHGVVLGVDACKRGWVGVRLGPEGRPTVHVAPEIGQLVELVGEGGVVDVVAIDIPIGLPDAGSRAADRLARGALPGKASSVFTTLTRAAYEAEDYAAAREANLRATATDEGSGTSASAQAYALRTKILQVDAWVRSEPAPIVVEVHPEVSFARMTGAPIASRKHDHEGLRRRREALQDAGISAPAWYRGTGFAEDDLLDACAAAWSAARHLAGESESMPAEPEVFSDGIPAAIWV